MPLKPILILTILASVFFSQVSQAFPEWSDYRTMSDFERAKFDQNVETIIALAKSSNFVSKTTRYCISGSVSNRLIWEKSPTSSCQSIAAVKHRWIPNMTNEGLSFDWIATMRLITAYCTVNSDQAACAKFRTVRPAAFLRLLNDLFPLANATEAVCKVVDGIMTTKTGNKIFVEFDVTPAEQHTSLLHQVAILAGDSSATETNVRDAVTSLKSIGKVQLKNYQDKLPRLRDLLKSEQVTWFGTELSENEFGDAAGKKIAASFDELKTQIGKRRSTIPEVADLFVAGACPDVTACLWILDKTVRQNIRLVPLDANDSKERILAVQKNMRSLEADLDALNASGKITKDEASIAKREYTNQMIISTPTGAKERKAIANRYGHPDLAKIVVGFFDSATELKSIQLEREKTISTKALAQQGNGILSVNSIRKSTLVPILETTCRGPELPATAPVKNRRPLRQ